MKAKTSDVLAVPGAHIYYEIQGTGPVLVMIGPGTSDASVFDPLMPFLADRFTVVTYDRRGYSRSTPIDVATPLSMATHAEDLSTLVRVLTSQPAFVFGSSAGAVVGLDFLIRYPDLVRLLVAHEPPLPSVIPSDMKEQFLKAKGPFEEALQKGDSATALKLLTQAVGATGAAAPGSEPKPGKKNQLFFLKHEAPAVDAYQLDLKRLTAWSQNVVVVAGEQSEGHFPYTCSDLLANRLGKSLIVFPGGHAGFQQEPAKFSHALGKSLLENEREGGR